MNQTLNPPSAHRIPGIAGTRLTVIASMKRGLEHFVYRELSAYAEQGVHINLFPTKCQPGLYWPRPEWSFHQWNPLIVLLLQPFYLLLRPVLYLRLFLEGLSTGTLVEVILAWYFSGRMRDDDAIYATFGDRKLFVGYYCKQITGLPLLVTIHAYELYENPNRSLFVKALQACDQVITVTEHNRELLSTEFGVDPGAIEVVRLGVDLDQYKPAEKFVVLIVGYFAERKGHETLFQAIRQLGRPDVEVWVVGDDGPETPVDVRGLARVHGVESQVAFFGSLSGNSLAAVYHACDVFCLPCRPESSGVCEGFPSVIIEAMAYGKPVISTTHVEIPRVLPDVLVPENDPRALAQAIDRLYRDEQLRRHLGQQNRALAENLFSVTNYEHSAQLIGALARSQQPIHGAIDLRAPSRNEATEEGVTA